MLVCFAAQSKQACVERAPAYCHMLQQDGVSRSKVIPFGSIQMQYMVITKCGQQLLPYRPCSSILSDCRAILLQYNHVDAVCMLIYSICTDCTYFNQQVLLMLHQECKDIPAFPIRYTAPLQWLGTGSAAPQA